MRRRAGRAEARAAGPVPAVAVVVALVLALAPAPVAGQGGGSATLGGQAAVAETPADGPVPLDGLASGPFSTLEMLYERTIFNIDILELLIVVDPETAAALEKLAAGRDDDGDAPGPRLAKEMVHAVLGAGDVAIQTRFRRGVGLGQFLDGMAESLGHAVADSLLAPADAEAIVAENREHFGALADRGFLEDDVLWYRIRGDSLEMAVQDADDEVLLEDARGGTVRREALLGGYLARGSQFREDLLASLFRQDG